MPDFSSVSIEKLIKIAHELELISDYRMTPGDISLYQGEDIVLKGDPEEVRFFLQGLLQGYHRVFPLIEEGGNQPFSSRPDDLEA